MSEIEYPVKVSGHYMERESDKEVHTDEELLDEIKRKLDLSPTGSLTISVIKH